MKMLEFVRLNKVERLTFNV